MALPERRMRRCRRQRVQRRRVDTRQPAAHVERRLVHRERLLPRPCLVPPHSQHPAGLGRQTNPAAPGGRQQGRNRARERTPRRRTCGGLHRLHLRPHPLPAPRSAERTGHPRGQRPPGHRPHLGGFHLLRRHLPRRVAHRPARTALQPPEPRLGRHLHQHPAGQRGRSHPRHPRGGKEHRPRQGIAGADTHHLRPRRQPGADAGTVPPPETRRDARLPNAVKNHP